jgi:hypothetical protein
MTPSVVCSIVNIPGLVSRYNIPESGCMLTRTRQSVPLSLDVVLPKETPGPIVWLLPPNKFVTLDLIFATPPDTSPAKFRRDWLGFVLPDIIGPAELLPNPADPYDGLENIPCFDSSTTGIIKFLLLFYYLFVKLTAYLKDQNETQLSK